MICITIHILPYFNETKNQIFPQQIHDLFALYSCGGCILFAVIRQKLVKHSMMHATV